MDKDKKIIHYSDWAGQPYIHLACADSDDITTPAWECNWENSPFLTEKGDWYTFDEEEVTCIVCKEKIDERYIQNEISGKFSPEL